MPSSGFRFSFLFTYYHILDAIIDLSYLFPKILLEDIM